MKLSPRTTRPTPVPNWPPPRDQIAKGLASRRPHRVANHVARRALAVALAGATVSMAACDEFPTPAELAKPQILAIRADPPAIPAGGTAVLTILVADSNGQVEAPDVTWQTSPTNPGEPALGSVAMVDGGSVIYTAPPQTAEAITLASVTARVKTDDSELVGVKVVTIADLTLGNPQIVAFTADGTDVLSAGSLTVKPGQIVELEAQLEPDSVGPDPAQTKFAWYSTAGTIERYQSNPVEMVAADASLQGWLFCVVRNGTGGVVWQAIRVTVE
ncbi:MAG: hypothetical protein MJE77_29810 [Proteobacteria bacterium]|nr:hypothetical protein [Pseudomonadota bacterium]